MTRRDHQYKIGLHLLERRSFAASYKLEFRLSQTDPNARLHAEVGGVNVTGSIAVPDTNVSRDVSFPVGGHALRLVFDATAANGAVPGVDRVKVKANLTQSPSPPPPGHGRGRSFRTLPPTSACRRAIHVAAHKLIGDR